MGTHKTVLVVDDDPLILASVAEALEAAGLRVWATSSAADAVRLVGEVRPDVVVTDLRMPGMDGLSLLGHLSQRSGPKPGTAIIYSAASPPPESLTRAVRWIPKAAGHEALIDALTGGVPDRQRQP